MAGGRRIVGAYGSLVETGCLTCKLYTATTVEETFLIVEEELGQS